ncbi:hypothetical protein QTQ03_07470 [Micromonospora sp. WMMA1363]|uniref:hypothetical protein n=1 Tax=Micromonospora sp. WMMA1363 TaxID=3053985 RepID=UPI00259CE689|nr:hypothetical protein [Micromonospora sp. WMMA1363]MDM4719445.1 hypothetical protein [Micromonospora sp. WMMA1363]
MSDDRAITSDDDLLVRLGNLLAEVDPVPAPVLASAIASYDWRTLDTELARLVDDSPSAVAGVRGAGARLLTFRADMLTIEVEMSRIRDRLRIVGQLVPPQPARVRVEQLDADAGTDADVLGRFMLENVAPGPTRLVCTPGDGGPAVFTEWTVL